MQRKELIAELRSAALVIAAILVARTLLGAFYYVPSGSMEPTLRIGDLILATKYPYGYSRYSTPLDLHVSGRLLGKLPKRGDVVVFQAPQNPDETMVKRVIGLPGDTLQMVAGHVVINGEELALRPDGEDAVESRGGGNENLERFIETLPGGYEHPIVKRGWNGYLDNTGVYTIPPDRLFMMGDNRDNSSDSRVPPSANGPGLVPVENLIGRADAVIGSWDFLYARQNIVNWFSSLRIARFFSVVR